MTTQKLYKGLLNLKESMKNDNEKADLFLNVKKNKPLSTQSKLEYQDSEEW